MAQHVEIGTPRWPLIASTRKIRPVAKVIEPPKPKVRPRGQQRGRRREQDDE